MGWSICVATERDPEQVTWLSRPFSYELLRDSGCLRAFITEQEAERLATDSLDTPEEWEERNADTIGQVLRRVRDMLKEANELLPVHHFLWFVDQNGKRWNGSTQITIPFGGIDLVYPHEPIIKLDGAHGDIDHRHELKTCRVRVDPVELERLNKGRVTYNLIGVPDVDPLVEEPEGWTAVEPVLEVLGQRVEVQSVDAFAMYEPDLTIAIELCDRAKGEGFSLFWLSG